MAQNVRHSQSILLELQDRSVGESDQHGNGIGSLLNDEYKARQLKEHSPWPGDVHSSLPLEVKLSANRIKEHARLVSDLLSTIKNLSYKITTKLRTRMHRLTMSEHVASWEQLAQKYGAEKLIPLFTQHHDLVSSRNPYCMPG